MVAEPQNHWWYVKSVEELSGMKVPSEPGGGHFTGIAHQGDYIVNTVQANYGSWVRFGNTLNYNSSTASSSITGKVTFASGGADVSVPTKTEAWAFWTAFP